MAVAVLDLRGHVPFLHVPGLENRPLVTNTHFQNAASFKTRENPSHIKELVVSALLSSPPPLQCFSHRCQLSHVRELATGRRLSAGRPGFQHRPDGSAPRCVSTRKRVPGIATRETAISAAFSSCSAPGAASAVRRGRISFRRVSSCTAPISSGNETEVRGASGAPLDCAASSNPTTSRETK